MSLGEHASPDLAPGEYNPFKLADAVRREHPQIDVLWLAGLFDQCFDLGYSYGANHLENPIYSTKPPAA